MIRREELAEIVVERTGCSGTLADACVNAIIEKLCAGLAGGEDVQLRGFGSFSREPTAAREGRNPRTGERAQIPAGYRVKFKAGKQLRDRMPAA